MKYRIVEKEAFTVVGKSTIVLCNESHILIPQFWEDCKKDGTIEKLQNLIDSFTIMGIGENVYHNNSFEYMIGVELKFTDDNSLKTKVIPKSTWVVFDPVLSKPNNVISMWEYIKGDFLPNSKYKMADTPDLEVNTKIGEDDYNCEIWIPVVEKNI